jgi:SAM-dependent methyltransferase
MSKFGFLSEEIGKGKSLIRATLNYRLQEILLSGKVMDLGAGANDQFTDPIPTGEGVVIEHVDQKQGSFLDFEKDSLPYGDGVYDTVLLLNVLEHLYNYKHILTEIKRIKKGEGTLIGYVPFLIWYHADPHDYFRYTHESLERILSETGFIDITIEKLHIGPYTTAFQMIHPTIPRIIRPFFFAIAYGIDMMFKKVRSGSAERYVLGYYFTAR